MSGSLVIAHGLGVAMYTTLTAIRFAIIIEETSWLFNLIKYAGVIMLLWLAYKALMSTSSVVRLDEQLLAVATRVAL